ncbi:MAG: hypothetical protein R3Y29_07005 [bacterium]
MIIKFQVDSIEKNVKELKKLGHKRQDRENIYNISAILPDNLWARYKNKLAKYIPSYDFESLDEFYNSAYIIHTAKVDIDNYIRKQWDCKMYFTQELISRKASAGVNITDDKIDNFIRSPGFFEPLIPDNTLETSLNNFKSIKGTTAY